MPEYFDVDRAVAELTAAGWIAKTPTIWKAPDGSLHLGPAGAHRTMQAHRPLTLSQDRTASISKAVNAEECSGRFTNARDCPVHDPRLSKGERAAKDFADSLGSVVDALKADNEDLQQKCKEAFDTAVHSEALRHHAEAERDAARRQVELIRELIERGPLPTISEENMRASRRGHHCEFCGHERHHSTNGACDFTFMVDNAQYRTWRNELLALLPAPRGETK